MDQSDLGLKLQLRGPLERLDIKLDPRSKKATIANIATMLYERASIKVLNLQYPLIKIHPKEKGKREHLYQSLPIKKVGDN